MPHSARTLATSSSTSSSGIVEGVAVIAAPARRRRSPRACPVRASNRCTNWKRRSALNDSRGSPDALIAASIGGFGPLDFEQRVHARVPLEPHRASPSWNVRMSRSIARVTMKPRASRIARHLLPDHRSSGVVSSRCLYPPSNDAGAFPVERRRGCRCGVRRTRRRSTLSRSGQAPVRIVVSPVHQASLPDTSRAPAARSRSAHADSSGTTAFSSVSRIVDRRAAPRPYR